MNNLTMKKTSLSTSSDVMETLKYKMMWLQEDGKDVQSGLADYIGQAISEIEGYESQLKELEHDIKERKAYLKEQKTHILTDGVGFMDDYVIEKLIGNLVSSINITKPKEATTKKVFKLLCTKEEAENFLIMSELATMVDKDVPLVKSKLRINRRKTGTVTIEE